MNPVRKMCLVAPGHLTSTPRLVKFADALTEAGNCVQVITVRSFPPLDDLDHRIIQRSKWSSTRIKLPKSYRVVRHVLRRFIRFSGSPVSLRFAALAFNAASDTMAATAKRWKADFYFGSGIAGLYAAATAAAHHRVPFGFDAEDFHRSESLAAIQDPSVRIPLLTLERSLIPMASLFTTSSPEIAQAYHQALGVGLPSVFLNVFPKSFAPPHYEIKIRRPAEAISFYWFSQTIGPGRGIEAFITILAHMRTPTRLCLRGYGDQSYVTHLRSKAAAIGYTGLIEILEPADACGMVHLAAEHHVGLSVEESEPQNRDLCLTNKIFTYLLAGLPTILTPTSSQKNLARDLGAAAILVDPKVPDQTAADLDLRLSGDWFEKAQQAAIQLAPKYTWDEDIPRWVNAVSKTLKNGN